MKRLKAHDDDFESYGEKSVVKDWGRRDEDSSVHRSSSSLHRNNSHYKSSESGRKVPSSSSSRYERTEDERENSRVVRKRVDYDLENTDRRKSYDRQRDMKERSILSSSPRSGYGTDKMYRSESFSGPRRDFPKGFRSERDRSRRDGSVSSTSWRRYGSNKDGDDVARSGSELSRGNRTGSEEVGKPRSPQVFRDAKSPAWSKDSGSEHSKSVEVKKYDDKSVESGGGPSTEREEGELEPDPQPHSSLPEPVVEDKDISEKEIDNCANENASQENEGAQSDNSENAPKMVPDVVNRNENLSDSMDTRENVTVEETECGNDVAEQRGEEAMRENDAGGSFDDNLSSLQEKKEKQSIDCEIKDDTPGNVGLVERAETPLAEGMVQAWKDKGKNVAVSPSNGVHFTETNVDVEYKQKDVPTDVDIDIEGPSTRGFQFFSSDPIKKQERVEESPNTKPNDDKLTLDLSLSLPSVLLPIGVHSMPQGPGSPSHAGSVQSFPSSFQTNSESFMPSMSFSGSQQFTHNLSCSLTNNGYDFEQSVKSKPLFKNVDWNALAENENKNKEIPSQQGTSSKGNGFYQPTQVSQGNPSAQANRLAGISSKELVGFERQLSFAKSLSGNQHIISSENGSRQKDNGGIRRSSSQNGKEEILAFGADFSESIVTMIVSEPLQTIARRFNEINEQHVASLKNFVLDIISNPGKQWQLSTLQTALRKRSDTLDGLMNANRTQLEILVALKTGLKEFILLKNDISSSDLAEIFLHTRCRNLACKSLLPVDECDCKICAPRNGFCRECMCLVCSKFDNASNTCSWVGCDVCLHWCHADCGLKESFIRNGRNAEMQFHCVACGHPSEMFGFVKEVFLNFLKEWTAENLYRELEYVRKIFLGSNDGRGKQLHEVAVRMLMKLGERADYKDVQNYIMRFFTEIDSIKHGNFSTEPRNELPAKNQERSVFPGSSQGAVWMKPAYPDKSSQSENPNKSLSLIRELPAKDHERSNGIAGSSQGPGWLKPAYLEKSTPLENVISGFDTGKYMDFRASAIKEPVFDELESIVRVKHAEAQMFQTRADDARRESEALKTIAVAKNERIEEEYSSRIAKLRLAEAEEMRRQKLEEFQDLDRAYNEYYSMKMRMETDIKDLLLKMEATRRNLTM